MVFRKEKWANSFRKDETTGWQCPTCMNGLLDSKTELVKNFENVSSKNLREEYPNIPLEATSSKFSGFLICNNSKCEERVAVSGDLFLESDVYINASGEAGEKIIEIMVPKFFYPELVFFALPSNCPEVIRDQIKKAFSHYWNDVDSSANNIRKSLELIMNEQNVRKTKTIKNKRRRLSLHNRIQLFEKKKPALKEYLMALKWIGNIGSHKNSKITKDQILEAFEVVNYCLLTLYDDQEKRLSQFVKSINKNKGI
jgi:hypothetical protein